MHGTEEARKLPFLTSRVGANFAGASKPRAMICSVTHNPPYIFLKTATIHTYYGISIAIPRYITMQLSTVPFFDVIATLDHCTSRYTAGGIHIESYLCSSIEL